MQVDVEHILACTLTICQKEVDAFTSEPAVSQSLRDMLGYPEHTSA